MKNLNEEMQKEFLLDLYKNPLNYGKLKNPNLEFLAKNPLCGDSFIVQVKLEKDIVKDISFFGSGCTISTASASLLTENFKEKSIDQIKDLKELDAINLLQIPGGITESRKKCATFFLNKTKENLK